MADDPKKEAMEKAIGELICIMNPYTHDMDIYIGNPDPDRIKLNPRQTEVEVDDKYPGTWAFKGEAQRINRSVRIKYRYPKQDANGNVPKDDDGNPLCWLDDYL